MEKPERKLREEYVMEDCMNPCDKALRIIINLKKSGHSMEYIARSLGDQERGYSGPSVWSVQRWIKGKVKMTTSNANRILEVYDSKK